MPKSNSITKTVADGDLFYDSGGAGSDYSGNEAGTITFNSDPGTVIRVTFTEFVVQNGGTNDYLRAYDGDETGSLIGTYYGTYDAWQASTRPDEITSSGNSLTFSFKSSNYTNYSGWEATIEVIGANEAFCNPSVVNYGNGNNQYIRNVLIGDIDNDSNSDGYTDYADSQSTDVEIGTDYLLTVTNIKYNIYWGSTPVYCVWVDWNQDGDFDDAGETIASESGVGAFTTTLTPPLDAVVGTTRMRVRLNHTVVATPCENTTWGEVEDYTLNVNAGDVIPPVFQNPQADITVDALEGTCGEIVNYEIPEATDNSSAFSETLSGFVYLGELDNHTYYYSNNSVNATTAIQDAVDKGGHLLTIGSQLENDFINNLVGAPIWIGFTDTNTEGDFQWVTNESVVYTNWNVGEPNEAGSEDYTEMYTDGAWNDLNGTNNMQYVIEFEGVLVTQTEGLTSGSLFPVGTTVNTFLATDYRGNTSTHSFNVTVVDVTPPKVSQLSADYYEGQNFDTFKENLLVDELNYSWGDGAPESSLIGTDNFSVRFQGNVQAPQDGIYTFYTNSDDGVRMWVDGQQLVDNWTDHGPTVNSGTIALSAGQITPITLEYYELGGGAVISLEWEGPGLAREFVSNNGTGTCQDLSIDISTAGSYNLTVAEVDKGYTDACGIDTRSLSKTNFTCDDVGTNPVTFTITDVNGNFSECNFNVIVVGGPIINLTVVGDSECLGTDANITIQESETGVVYSAYNIDGVQVGSSVTGNGSDIIISIPTIGFSEGDNTISVKAQSAVCIVSLINTAVVAISEVPSPLGVFHE